MSSGNATSPFLDGPGWIGTFTLPVCDIGTHDWATAYDDSSTGRFGMLPCCCGPDCSETAAFVKAANMQGFQTLLRGCKSQYAEGWKNVDYGFKWKNSIQFKWAMWGAGKRAAVVLSSLFLPFMAPIWAFAVPE
jgi:hypothetical protein